MVISSLSRYVCRSKKGFFILFHLYARIKLAGVNHIHHLPPLIPSLSMNNYLPNIYEISLLYLDLYIYIHTYIILYTTFNCFRIEFKGANRRITIDAN